jgi:hypothetical protein
LVGGDDKGLLHGKKNFLFFIFILKNLLAVQANVVTTVILDNYVMLSGIKEIHKLIRLVKNKYFFINYYYFFLVK